MDEMDEELQRAYEIGVENAELLVLAHAWCKHVGRDRGPLGVGIPEQMTGLPISGGSLRCDYAKSPPTIYGMRMGHGALEFYESNCVGCPHREPGGEPPDLRTWAEERRREADAAAVEREAARIARQAARDVRARERRIRLGNGRAVRGQILDLLERIDVEEPDAESTADLLVLAEHDPSVFDDDVMESVLGTAMARRIPSLVDAVVIAHERRGRPDSTVVPIAEAALRNGISSERIGATVGRGGNVADEAIVTQAIWLAGGANRDIGEPGESPHPEALERLYDVDPTVTTATLALLVREEEPWARARAARAASEIICRRPEIAAALIDPLLDGLALPDTSRYLGDPYAAGAARKALRSALLHEHEAVDASIQARWPAGDPRLRRELLGCYKVSNSDLLTVDTARTASTRLESALFDPDADVADLASNALAHMAREATSSPVMQEGMTGVSVDLVVRLAAHVDGVEGRAVAPGLDAMTHYSTVLGLDASLRSVAEASGLLGRANPEAFIGQVDAAWERVARSPRSRRALLRSLEEGIEKERGLGAARTFLAKVLATGTDDDRYTAIGVLDDVMRWSEDSLPPDLHDPVLSCLLDPRMTEEALDLVRFLTIPLERLPDVLNALLRALQRPLFSRLNVHRARHALSIARRLAADTPLAGEVDRLAFDIIDLMYTGDAAEVLEAAPEDHPRWVSSAIRALHHDEDAAYRRLKDEERRRLLLRLLDHPDQVRAELAEVVRVGLERILDDAHHDAWEVADVLAQLGEHDAAAEICANSFASLPDVPEQQGRRRHSKTLELSHRVESAIQRGDADAVARLTAELEAIRAHHDD